MDLMQKTLLLIGPGEYFGKELIQTFLSAGYKVGILTSSEVSLQKCKKETGISIGGYADITDVKEYRKCLRKLAGELGSISCLIYNPKYSPKGTGLELSVEEFEKSLAINATGAVIAIQELASVMKEGKVLLTGGGYKDNPDPNKFALSVGKSALHGVYEALKETEISIGTVIIDGFVREGNSINPQRVAQAFLEMAEGKSTEKVLKS